MRFSAALGIRINSSTLTGNENSAFYLTQNPFNKTTLAKVENLIIFSGKVVLYQLSYFRILILKM